MEYDDEGVVRSKKKKKTMPGVTKCRKKINMK
jgi:hypothetical protein